MSACRHCQKIIEAGERVEKAWREVTTVGGRGSADQLDREQLVLRNAVALPCLCGSRPKAMLALAPASTPPPAASHR